MNAEPINERPFEPGDTYQGMPVPRAPMALTVAERAASVFTAVPSEEDLRELAKKSLTITAITNDDGKAQCHAARMVLKNTRLEIARVGEVGREDAVQASKAIIAIQKARIAVISPEEDRLAAIQKTWDDRIAAEKEAKIQAEIARVAQIHRFIEGIRIWPVQAAGKPSALINQMLQTATDYEITEEVFQERTAEAKTVLIASTAALQGIHTTALAQEAEAERVRLGMLELAKMKAEQVERGRLANEERIAREAIDKAHRDAAAAVVAEANRVERARIAQEEADAKVTRDAIFKKLNDDRLENDRIARERQAEVDAEAERQRQINAAEAGRIAAQRAQLEADQAKARKAAEHKPRIVERPTAAQIVAVIAGHYSVSTEMAEKWLQGIRWESAAA